MIDTVSLTGRVRAADTVPLQPFARGQPLLHHTVCRIAPARFQNLLENSVNARALFGRGGYIFRDINKLFHTDGDGIAGFFYVFHSSDPFDLTADAV